MAGSGSTQTVTIDNPLQFKNSEVMDKRLDVTLGGKLQSVDRDISVTGSNTQVQDYLPSGTLTAVDSLAQSLIASFGTDWNAAILSELASDCRYVWGQMLYIDERNDGLHEQYTQVAVKSVADMATLGGQIVTDLQGLGTQLTTDIGGVATEITDKYDAIFEEYLSQIEVIIAEQTARWHEEVMIRHTERLLAAGSSRNATVILLNTRDQSDMTQRITALRAKLTQEAYAMKDKAIGLSAQTEIQAYQLGSSLASDGYLRKLETGVNSVKQEITTVIAGIEAETQARTQTITQRLQVIDALWKSGHTTFMDKSNLFQAILGILRGASVTIDNDSTQTTEDNNVIIDVSLTGGYTNRISRNVESTNTPDPGGAVENAINDSSSLFNTAMSSILTAAQAPF